jgi:hypothetical protein
MTDYRLRAGLPATAQAIHVKHVMPDDPEAGRTIRRTDGEFQTRATDAACALETDSRETSRAGASGKASDEQSGIRPDGRSILDSRETRHAIFGSSKASWRQPPDHFPMQKRPKM